MIPSDLSLIENRLGLVLPESYKRIMLNYPFKDKEYQVVQENLIDNPNELIALNLHYWKNGYQGKKLPQKSYIFGKIGESDIFFTILENDDHETIYYLSADKKYNPKNLDKLVLSNSFEEFIKQTKVLQDIYNNP